jgi:gliding-associated putative ABC transporter substrate-binding component GldG
MKMDRKVFVLAVLGSLIFVNVIGVKSFGRLDLTRDGQYTLAGATEDALRRLQDPVTVKAYFTKDLPPPYSTNARYVRDLLDEYFNAGKGYFRYEFIDPTEEETSEDKAKKKEVKHDIFGRQVREATSIESELQTLGIPPVQVQAREDDKLEVKRAYMGLAIKYGDKSEVIPVVQQTQKLEYDLTTLIRKLTRVKTPKIIIARAEGSLDVEKEAGRIYGLLGQLYDVSTQDLNTDSALGEDVDGIVVLGGKEPFTEDAQKSIDQFVVSGRSAAFLMDSIKPELSTLQSEDANHGLHDLLSRYGVQIESGLALDVACATMTVQRQQGFMRIAQPVQFPFIPMAQPTDPDHPLTRGMSEVALPFTSPLTINVGEGSALTAQSLLKTSEKAWVTDAPYNLDPFQRWTQDKVTSQRSLDLLVTVAGVFPSAFAPETDDAQSQSSEGAKGRILVAGTSAFLGDQFMSGVNQALALNLIDWLLLDEGLLKMRSRGLAGAKLDEDLEDSTRNLVRYSNMVGVPLIFVLFGVFRWRRREARRDKISI